jgi:EAL domain-containing protein (putative c-di-GMP-specific phosphodiesterase class I)
MDNFGAGYSSKSRALVQAIINLRSNLDMKTIAEGVETEVQFQELVSIGCMVVQGYLISRLIAAKVIPEFISTNRTNNTYFKRGQE